MCQNIPHFLSFCLPSLLLSSLDYCSSFCLLALQLTLNPVQQQLLIQQAQAQLLAAAVQHSASQQNNTTGANISASAATPITQLPLSQPIQITPVSRNDPCICVSAAVIDCLVSIHSFCFYGNYFHSYFPKPCRNYSITLVLNLMKNLNAIL